MQTQTGIDQAVFEAIHGRLGIGVVVCDYGQRVLWKSDWIDERFRGCLAVGERISRLLDDVLIPFSIQVETSTLFDSAAADGIYGTREHESHEPFYRHIEFPIGGSGDGKTVHCLVDVTREEVTFLDQLQQLTSTKEIIDTLYESVSTQEVLYLILVAVTSQRGFGFNRAFYLEARGERLKGKIGIGPSNREDAHRIWARLAELDLPSLRAIYEDFTHSVGTPDPQTQEIAAQLNFPLRPAEVGLLGAIVRRKPALIHASGPCGEVDRKLFRRLGTGVVAVVPLYVREALAGVLIADNFITESPISEKSLNLLKTFSGYAGVALERSQLYDELRDSVAKHQSANWRLKTHQRRLLQAEKLSAIGELAACVSHEIRNPLVAIGGLARSLLKKDSLTSDTRDCLSTIVHQVTRLEKFLGETLDFVKPEIEGARQVDLRDEIGQVVSDLRAELAERSIDLRICLGSEPLPCLVDPDLLQRAMSNLVKNSIEAQEVKNSIEAQEKGGKVFISAEGQRFSAEIRVADNGPGIPRDLQSRIFEPFFTTKPEGTGLGLAIASQGIRSLGGNISLQSSDEFQTIFSITLPLASASRGLGERRKKSGEGGSNENGTHSR